MNMPCCLWRNTFADQRLAQPEPDDEGADGAEDEEDEDPPHDTTRCEACRLGVCDMMDYY